MDKIIFEKIVRMGLIDDTSVTAESFKDLDDLFGSGKITVTGVKEYVYKLFGNVSEEPVVEVVSEEPVKKTTTKKTTTKKTE